MTRNRFVPHLKLEWSFLQVQEAPLRYGDEY